MILFTEKEIFVKIGVCQISQIGTVEYACETIQLIDQIENDTLDLLLLSSQEEIKAFSSK